MVGWGKEVDQKIDKAQSRLDGLKHLLLRLLSF